MKAVLIIVAGIALGLTVIPPFQFFVQSLENHQTVKTLMLVGTVLWFASAIPLLGFRDKKGPS